VPEWGMPGVTIMEKGTSNVVTSGADGIFTIKVAGEHSILVFSSVGYDNQELKVGNRTNLTIGLVQGNKDLGEVIVVGYGTKKKRSHYSFNFFGNK
jgi:hypothetical protein